MKILFVKSKWEAPKLSLIDFLDRVRADGFDGTELFIPGQQETPTQIHDAHAKRRLVLVAQIITEGATLEEHQRSFEDRLRRAAECRPLFVNCHAGSDLFSDGDNQRLCEFGIDLARSLGVPLCFETHRGRPTFSGPSTRRLLQAVPELRLTADFSHWMCVHESLLANQPENLGLAIGRSDHIHARIGFSQGPQVPHPMAPECSELRDLSLNWWRRIAEARAADGREFLTVTPEAGPPPYMSALPFSNQPVADAWQVNIAVRDWLRAALN